MEDGVYSGASLSCWSARLVPFVRSSTTAVADRIVFGRPRTDRALAFQTAEFSHGVKSDIRLL